MRPLFVALMLTLFVSGCKDSSLDSQQGVTDNEGKTTFTHTLNIDGITVAAAGTPSRSEKSPEGYRLFQVGDHRFHFEDGKLHVNAKSYGEVTEGDEVEITKDGSVLVNGKARSPVSTP